MNLASGNSTILTSPSYPLYYPDDVDVQWQITSPSGSVIRVVFTKFSLAINEDFLYITNNGSRSSAVTLVSFTGTNAEGKVLLSDGNELWLRFVAGDSANVRPGMGFVIELTVEGISIHMSKT